MSEKLQRRSEYARGTLAFYVWKDKRVIQFKMLMGFGLPSSYAMDYPMASDLGYHSPVPMYEGQGKMEGRCEWTDGDCYYDGTSLGAQEPMDILLQHGDEKLYRFLEDHWRRVFDKGEAGGFGQTIAALAGALEE